MAVVFFVLAVVFFILTFILYMLATRKIMTSYAPLSFWDVILILLKPFVSLVLCVGSVIGFLSVR